MVLFNDYVCYGKGSFGGEVQFSQVGFSELSIGVLQLDRCIYHICVARLIFSQVMDLSAVLCDPLDVFLDETVRACAKRRMCMYYA